ncbi:MAG: two-component regulator propeller domain-containing protein, partial [Candidatus Poribacteria bacterium]|nr:two-component regulator propeller domain-containing protein [Candidatus Poribacteria bacterium]
GLWQFDGIRWQQFDKLSTVGVHLVQETLDGTVWVGTLTHGVWQFDGQIWDQPKDLRGTEVRSMIASKKTNNLWVGTFAKGLWQFDGESWFQHFEPSWDEPGDIAISYLLETRRGKILAGTWGRGLWSFDGSKWYQEKIPMQGNIIGRIWEIENEQVWIYYRDVLRSDGRPGASSNWGIYRFVDSAWEEVFYRRNVPVMLESSDGSIWASMSVWSGANEWGLWRFDGRKWYEQEELKGKKVTTLLNIADGSLLVGTQENGLWKFDGQNWYSFTTLDGLPSPRIAALLQDRNGIFWVGTGAGMARYRFNSNPPIIEIKTVDGEETDYFQDPDRDLIYTTGKSGVFVQWNAFDKETPAGRLTYQYRMNQGDWSLPTAATSTTTPPMESGKHTFTVRAIDRDANLSQSDSFTFQVDLERPEVQITLPTDQTIVSGRQEKIVIRGTVTDKDLDQFRVEVAPLANPSRFQLVNQVEDAGKAGGRDRPLGLWQTQRLAQTDYLIRLSAQDKLGHQKSDQIQVTLDNTVPSVQITAPKDQERVLKQFTISAATSDLHLNSYRLDFASTDNPDYTTTWEQIFVQANLYQQEKDEQLKKPQVAEFEKDWEVPIKEGVIWLRVMATDMAGNSASQMIQVKIPTTLLTRQGGSVTPEDRQAELYFPPN